MSALGDLYYYLGAGSGPIEQTLMLAPAVSGPRAFGPAQLTVPGEEIPPVAVHVVNRDVLWQSIGVLDQSFGRTWQDQISEPGAGSVSLDNRDPDLALIGDNSLLRFELNGQAQLIVNPNDRTQVTIAPGEEHDQITTLQGPGHLAVLAESIVYPSRGVGSIPIEDDRTFSWPSPDYEDDGWAQATAIVKQSDSTLWWNDLPNAFWPDPDAYWIWAHQGTQASAPPGTCYFRRTFTTGPVTIIVFFTVDDTGSVFIDGLRMAELDVGNRTIGSGPNEIRYAKIELSDGDHVIAVEATNSPTNPLDDPDTTNPAGFLMAVYEVNAFGELGTEILWTDSDWKIVEYPPYPPGMTPGRVIEILMAEAAVRGSLPPLLLEFDQDVDSNGNPWPVVADISTKVGTDYLTFLREMSGTYFDMWMAPGGWMLHLFSLGEQGTTTAISWHPPTDEDDPTTGNLEQLTHRRIT